MKAFFESRKNWTSIVATVLATIPLVFTIANNGFKQSETAITFWMVAVAAAWGINTASIAYEDGKKQQAQAVVDAATVAATSAEKQAMMHTSRVENPNAPSSNLPATDPVVDASRPGMPVG